MSLHRDTSGAAHYVEVVSYCSLSKKENNSLGDFRAANLDIEVVLPVTIFLIALPSHFYSFLM